MPDESDPPRKFYGFKPREFDRANAPRAGEPATSAAAPDPGITPVSDEKIDVHQLIRAGAGAGDQLGTNQAANRETEVHAILRANARRDLATGHYDLGPLDDAKRRRRIRNYWIAMVAVNVPLGIGAGLIGPHGVGQAFTFPFLIAAMALFSSVLTWRTFFLRTHY